MQFLTPTTLTGYLVSLEPLDDVHIEGLRAAVQDGHINDLWYTPLDTEQLRASGPSSLSTHPADTRHPRGYPSRNPK